MTADDAERIHRYLVARGRPGRTTVGRLVAEFGLDAASADDRATVAAALDRRGIACDPPLEVAERPDAPVAVSVVEPAAAEDPAPARARAAAGPPGDGPLERALRPALAPGRPELVLLGGGALIVLAGLFLPWYTGERARIQVEDLSTGWQWLGVLDVLLATLALAAVVVATQAPTPARRLRARVVLVAAGGALVAVLVRMVSPPDRRLGGVALDVSVSVGPFVVGAGLTAVALGAAALAGLPADRGPGGARG